MVQISVLFHTFPPLMNLDLKRAIQLFYQGKRLEDGEAKKLKVLMFGATNR